MIYRHGRAPVAGGVHVQLRSGGGSMCLVDLRKAQRGEWGRCSTRCCWGDREDKPALTWCRAWTEKNAEGVFSSQPHPMKRIPPACPTTTPESRPSPSVRDCLSGGAYDPLVVPRPPWCRFPVGGRGGGEDPFVNPLICHFLEFDGFVRVPRFLFQCQRCECGIP